jgi:hypothetical protein
MSEVHAGEIIGQEEMRDSQEVPGLLMTTPPPEGLPKE